MNQSMVNIESGKKSWHCIFRKIVGQQASNLHLMRSWWILCLNRKW